MLVPEGRNEVTTEGGLDVTGQQARMNELVGQPEGAGIHVRMCIDAEESQIDASKQAGAKFIELHTGQFAGAKGV